MSKKATTKNSTESNKPSSKKEYKKYDNNLNTFTKDNPEVDYTKSVKSKAQEQAIDNYMTVSSHLNHALEVGSTNPEIKKEVDLMDSCITNKLSSNVCVYKGVMQDANDMKIGDVITNKGYTSTSISKKVANEFALEYGGATLAINVPKGTKALYLGNRLISNYKELYGDQPNEYELLFGRNMKIKITGKKDDIVYAEVITE